MSSVSRDPPTEDSFKYEEKKNRKLREKYEKN